jgi:hypothetical protein
MNTKELDTDYLEYGEGGHDTTSTLQIIYLIKFNLNMEDLPLPPNSFHEDVHQLLIGPSVCASCSHIPE